VNAVKHPYSPRVTHPAFDFTINEEVDPQ